MKYESAMNWCKRAGLSIKDGLAFTVSQGRLVNGEPAPSWLRRLNGCTVEEAGPLIRKHVKQQGN